MRERWQMFAENWSVRRFLEERFGTNRGRGSNRDAPWHPARDLQQVGFQGDDLVLAVPFAGEHLLQSIRPEPDGAVDEVDARIVLHAVKSNVRSHPAS